MNRVKVGLVKIPVTNFNIKKRGGRFASDIVDSADGGMFFILQDPDGNRFKITQSLA